MNLSWFYLYSQKLTYVAQSQKLLQIHTSGGGGGFENSDTSGQEGVVWSSGPLYKFQKTDYFVL